MMNRSDDAVTFGRRDVLRFGGFAATAVGFGGLLTACAADPTVKASSSLAKPVRGGRLVLAVAGAGVKEALDPHFQVTGVDFVRSTNIFDRLAERLDGKINMRLAETMEPNADATVWTIKLRSGVVWHDGKPFTADDVIYTWNRMVKDQTGDSANLNPIDLPKVKKSGDLELTVPMKYAFASLPEIFITDSMGIIQDGTKSFEKAIGTGPFKLAAFSPGREFTLKRNDQYWEEGLPYLDEVVVRSLDDPTARINSILGGQVNVSSGVPSAQARPLVKGGVDLSTAGVLDTNRQGLRLVNSASSHAEVFAMDCRSKPFSDVRVRQAMRLATDRKQAIESAYSGFAALGNDMFGLGFEGYPNLPQRSYDPEQAKFLLKQAGYDGLKLDTYVTAGEEGFVERGTVLQQSGRAAGIDLTVKKVPQGDFWSNYWMQKSFFPSWWTRKTLLSQYGLSMASNALYNEAQLRSPEMDNLYKQAVGTVDATKRAELLTQVNKWHYDQGGYIIQAFSNPLDLIDAKVQGVRPNGPNALNDYRFRLLWLAA